MSYLIAGQRVLTGKYETYLTAGQRVLTSKYETYLTAGHRVITGKYESYLIAWCDGSSDRSFIVDPLRYFSFQSVLHDWCNKDRGVCSPVCGMVHIK